MAVQVRRGLLEQAHGLQVAGTYLGLDPSLTSFGVAVILPGRVLSWNWGPALRGAERLDWYDAQVAELLGEHGGGAACLEDYAHARANQAHQLGELGGVLRLALWRSKVRHWAVAPATLKKAITSKGVGPKSAMTLALYKRFGVEVVDDDQADAVGCALVAAHLSEGLPSLTKEQQAAMAKARPMGVRR